MIAFRGSIDINRPREAVFHVLANIHLVRQAEASPVRALELVTTGPPGLGSRYREVVRMLPFYDGEITSQITAFDPPTLLEESFAGAGMTGRLRYSLTETGAGTELLQEQWFAYHGLLRTFEPIIQRALFPRLEARLGDLKRGLEEGHDMEEAERAPIRAR